VGYGDQSRAWSKAASIHGREAGLDAKVLRIIDEEPLEIRFAFTESG